MSRKRFSLMLGVLMVDSGAGGTENRFEGDEANAVLAGVIRGGVHFHGSRPRSRRPNQLNPTPDHYTNYEGQLEKLSDFLLPVGEESGPKVVIVIGPPGSGRSTLAGRWTHTHRDRYSDGIFVVRFGARAHGADDERQVLADLLVAVGYDGATLPESLDGRAAWWRAETEGKRIALIIDDAVSRHQVEALLPGSGPSAVLVVQAGALGGLRARVGAGTVTIDPLGPEPARLLLRRLVGADRIDVEPDAMTALITRCAGNTAALCVVGAMLAEFEQRPISWLAAKLADDERALAELSRDEDLSLTVVFDAAYQRLSDLAKRCYQALGTHPGTGDSGVATVAGVMGVRLADAEYAVTELLRAMFVTEPAMDRALMPGLFRAHARSSAGPDRDQLTRRTIRHYWQRALESMRAWPDRGWLRLLWPELDGTGAVDKAAARRWMATERMNLRAVVDEAVALEEFEVVCQLCLALWPGQLEGADYTDIVAVNQHAVAAAAELDNDLAAAVHGNFLALAHLRRAELDKAETAALAARVAAERSGSLAAIATAAETLGLIRYDQGNLAEAWQLWEYSAALAERIGDRRRLAVIWFHLAKVVAPEDAFDLHARSRAEFAALDQDESYNLMKITLWRGKRLLELARWPEVAAALDEAGADADEHGWHQERAQVCEARAELAFRTGRRAEGVDHLRDALDIYRLRGMVAQAVTVETRLRDLGVPVSDEHDPR